MKKSKNLVAAILLAFLLGPIGLFYASIWGGLIMTLGPVLLAILFSDGNVSNILASLFVYGLVGFAIYWPICIIWAASATIRFNKRTVEENHYNESIEQAYSAVTDDSKMIIWLKENPSKGINDYYSQNE